MALDHNIDLKNFWGSLSQHCSFICGPTLVECLSKTTLPCKITWVSFREGIWKGADGATSVKRQVL